MVEIWTDGSIAPLDALKAAAGLLSKRFESVSEISLSDDAKDTDGGPVETLGFSNRTLNALRANGIHSVGGVAGCAALRDQGDAGRWAEGFRRNSGGGRPKGERRTKR